MVGVIRAEKKRRRRRSAQRKRPVVHVVWVDAAGSKQKGWWRSTGVLQKWVDKGSAVDGGWNYLLGQGGRLMTMVMMSFSMVFSPG